MQDHKDESGLQFINFGFVTGGQEIEVSILVACEYSHLSLLPAAWGVRL